MSSYPVPDEHAWPAQQLPVTIYPLVQRGQRQTIYAAGMVVLVGLLIAGAINMLASDPSNTWAAIFALLILGLAMVGALNNLVVGLRGSRRQAPGITVATYGIDYKNKQYQFHNVRTIEFKTGQLTSNSISAGSVLANKASTWGGMADGLRHLILTMQDGAKATINLGTEFGWDEWFQLEEVLASLAREYGIAIEYSGQLPEDALRVLNQRRQGPSDQRRSN